jgi:microcystin-dependent protein
MFANRLRQCLKQILVPGRRNRATRRNNRLQQTSSRLHLEVLEERALLDTGITGGGLPFDITKPSLPLHYIIAEQGIYPPHDDGTPPSPSLGAGQEPFLAEVRLFAGNFAPGGWDFCDGQLLSIAQNTALFSLLGTTYGGNGTFNFALPDLRGRVVVEAGQGPGLTDRALGEQFGAETATLTDAELPAHTHTLPSGGTTGVDGGGQPFAITEPALALHYIVPLQVSTDAGASSALFPEIRIFAGNFAPAGWAFADGQLLSIAQNSELFTFLGTTYGGDGVSTFALPDLRGRVDVGAGQVLGLTNRTVGQQFGAESHTLTVAEMPAHDHTLSGGGTSGVTGGSQAFDIMQPSLVTNYIVALAGVFPSRPPGVSGFSTSPMLGEVRPFSGLSAPRGWALAQGQLLPISQNQALFSLLGTTYGGNGITTFALPDLRGRTPVEAGQGPGLTNRDLGVPFGAESVTLTVGQLAPHSHTALVLQLPPLAPGLLFRYRRPLGFGGFQMVNSTAVSVGTSFDAVQDDGLSLLNPIVQGDVDASASQVMAVGLIARIQRNGNAYVAALTHDKTAEILLFHGASNTFTILDSRPAATNVATLKFTVTGTGPATTLSLFLDNSATPLVQVTGSMQTTLDSAGGAGVFAWGANGTIDNFSLKGA